MGPPSFSRVAHCLHGWNSNYEWIPYHLLALALRLQSNWVFEPEPNSLQLFQLASEE